MAGKYAPDIEKLVMILTIAIAASLVIVAAMGAVFLLKNLNGDDSPEDSSVPAETSVPAPSESYPVNAQVSLDGTEESAETASTGIQNETDRSFLMPVDASVNDSITNTGCFIPDDPDFSPPEFNNTAADHTLTIEHYQVLYQEEQHFVYDTTSMIVNVGKGPLVVCYDILEVDNPSRSSTGSTADEKYTEESSGTIEDLPVENPYYSFFDVTVIDNSTGEIVGTGGFGRTYASTDEQYISIPMTGEFRIEVYGNGLEVELRVLSGTVPENPNAIAVDPCMRNKYSIVREETLQTQTSTDESEEYEEEWW